MGLLDYFSNQSNPNAGAWGGDPMGGDSSSGVGFMGGMQDPRAMYKMQQMLKAASRPVQGQGKGAWASALTNLLQGYMGGQDEAGYQEHAQNQEAKQLQMDSLRAQGQERTAQAQALQQKAVADQKRQGLVSQAMQEWNSPNRGQANGPTTPEYAAMAPQMAQPRSNDPRDLYSHVASALERGGDLQGGFQQRLEAQKLSPQVEKLEVQMVNGQPRQVAFMKDGSYKVMDGIAPTAKLQFENLGDRTAMIDQYTGNQSGSFKRGQSPDSVASNANSMRIAGMTDARARDFNAITQQGNGATAETGLRKEFADLPEVKRYKAAFPAFEAVRSASSRSTPQSDINLIYGVAKLYDPESVVREGEYATLANSQAIPERIKGMAQFIAGGGKLSAETKKQIMIEAESRIGAYEGQYQGAQESYGQIARKRGASPDNIFTPVGRIDQAGQKRRATDNASKGGFKILSVD